MSSISGVSNMREATMPQVNKVKPKPAATPSPQQKLASMFQKIDTEGKGSITKAQFEQVFSKLDTPPALKAMGAEETFKKLDAKGTGVVSKDEFIKGMESVIEQAKSGKPAPAKAAPAVAKAAPAAAPAAHHVAQTYSAPSAPAAHPASQGAVGNTINLTA